MDDLGKISLIKNINQNRLLKGKIIKNSYCSFYTPTIITRIPIYEDKYENKK